MGVYGPNHFSLHPDRSIDGATTWAEYLQCQLNRIHVAEPGFVDDLPTLPIIPKLVDPPSFFDVEYAILSLNDNITDGT